MSRADVFDDFLAPLTAITIFTLNNRKMTDNRIQLREFYMFEKKLRALLQSHHLTVDELFFSRKPKSSMMELLCNAEILEKVISENLNLNLITYYECVQLSRRIEKIILSLEKEPKSEEIEKTINVLLVTILNLELSITAVKQYAFLTADSEE